MDNITLVILAAGIGSRFKGGVKQLAKINENKDTLMELSIKDAKKAGINKVVFIIREELKNDFIKQIIPRLEIDSELVYQDMNNIPLKLDFKRSKPWGTAHALLSLKNIIKEDFIIINADDYYGKDAFKKIVNYFKSEKNNSVMIGYKLKNTVFSKKCVNRGICKIENGFLKCIEETYDIKKEDGLFVSGEQQLDPNSLVSMNIWGFHKDVFELYEQSFINFLKTKDINKDEFLIPNVVKEYINKLNVKVIETDDICAGITYQDDIEDFKKITNTI